MTAETQRFSTVAAASYLGISLPMLKKLRRFGAGPVYIKIGRKVLYDVADLNVYLEANKHQPKAA